MAKDKEEGGYCFDILKAGLTEKEMSGWGRVWSISVGLVGTIVADPVIWTCKKLGVEGDGKGFDPSDPNDPSNTFP